LQDTPRCGARRHERILSIGAAVFLFIQNIEPRYGFGGGAAVSRCGAESTTAGSFVGIGQMACRPTTEHSVIARFYAWDCGCGPRCKNSLQQFSNSGGARRHPVYKPEVIDSRQFFRRKHELQSAGPEIVHVAASTRMLMPKSKYPICSDIEMFRRPSIKDWRHFSITEVVPRLPRTPRVATPRRGPLTAAT
jgi:hypothetical protein